MPDAIAEPPEQRFARCLLVAEPRGEPIDRRLDLGDPPRERVDAVAGGAIEGGLVGLQHRKHRFALRGDPFARFVDRARGAIEQSVDRARHLAGDAFEPRARGLAGRLPPPYVRSALLRPPAPYLVPPAPPPGDQRQLRAE